MRMLVGTLLSLPLIAGMGLSSEDRKAAEDPLERELAELLNAKVTVASKKAEPTADAAATITSYSSHFLEQTGISTLGDLAEVTPGYTSFSIYGERVFETRGQKAGSFNNNRHLLLVDGIPVHHARNYKVFTEEELPLQFAERVEFLRGPASSLYGIGAFFGVVSITPKRSRNGTGAEILAGGGNDARSKRIMATLTHGDAAAETLLSFSCFNRGDSGAFAGVADSSLNTYRDGRTALFMMVSHKLKQGALEGLAFGTIFTYKAGGLGEHWNWGTFTSPVNQLTWATLIPYLKYERKLSDTVSFNGYLKYNESQEKGGSAPFSAPPVNFPGTGAVFGAYDIRIADYEMLAEVQWSPDPTLDVVAGFNGDTRWQKGAADGGYNIVMGADPGWPYAEVPVKKTGDYRTTSLYVQARKQLPILSGLHLVAGLRMDRGEAPGNRYQQLSPRVGLVQKVTDRFNLKVLYGTALRGPGIKEVELNAEKKLLYPDMSLASLGAETFRTTECAATYTAPFWSASLTWFTNRTTDTLDPSPTLHGAFFNNRGTTDASGVEAEFRFAMGSGWRGWLSASAAKATDPYGRELNEVPVSTGSAGLTYMALLGLPIQLSGILRYHGDFRVSDPALPRPGGGTFLDIRVGLPPTDRLGASLEVRNLTDQAMKYPKAARPDVPAPGRTVRLNLWIRF